MKPFFVLAAAIALLSACNQSASTNSSSADSSNSGKQTSATSKEERNKQIAVKGVMGFITGDTSFFNDADPSCVDYNDGTMPPLKGVDSMKTIDLKMMNMWKTAFPDIKMNHVAAVANGDTVMVWEEYSGTSKGDFMGQKPTGKSFDVYQVDYFVFNNAGKIVEHRMTPNFNEVAKQIGMKY